MVRVETERPDPPAGAELFILAYPGFICKVAVDKDTNATNDIDWITRIFTHVGNVKNNEG